MDKTILEWDQEDLEHNYARRMATDRMFCHFKTTWPAKRINRVRNLWDDKKQQQMRQIVQVLAEQ